jgi:hypothetical protein
MKAFGDGLDVEDERGLVAFKSVMGGEASLLNTLNLLTGS